MSCQMACDRVQVLVYNPVVKFTTGFPLPTNNRHVILAPRKRSQAERICMYISKDL